MKPNDRGLEIVVAGILLVFVTILLGLLILLCVHYCL